jgi:Cysteine rich repeat
MRAILGAVLMAAMLMPLGLRPASAQAADVLLQLIAHCRRDAAELCPEVEPGGGRIAACLYSRLNDLTPGCHRAMRDGIALRACGGEFHRFCGDVAIGEGQVARCLREFRDAVGPRCAEALAFSGPRYAERGYGDRGYAERGYGGPRWEDYRAPPPPPAYDRKYRDEPEPEYDDRGPDDLK